LAPSEVPSGEDAEGMDIMPGICATAEVTTIDRASKDESMYFIFFL
jgi:hypothetical protein